MFAVDVHYHQDPPPVDPRLIQRAVRRIVEDQAIHRGRIGVALVDDATIRQLNRRHLGHDEATDVLSYPLERGEDFLEGEVIVSTETAAAAAPHYGWSAEQELLLYVIHGTLHLVGWDDRTAPERNEMQDQEKRYLAKLGVPPATA